jgi:hypothetical protein
VLLCLQPACAIEITQVKNKFPCPELGNAQECAMKFEAAFLRAHPGLVLKEKDHLKIRLHGGRHVGIRDGHGGRLDPSSAGTRNVVELQGAGRFLTIREQFFEGNSWQILDLKTGKLTDVFGYPLFSPDGRRFVVSDFPQEYNKSVFDIYEVSDAGVSRTYRGFSKLRGWYPYDIRWAGNESIRFSRQSTTTFNMKGPKPLTGGSSILEFRKGSWTMGGGASR